MTISSTSRTAGPFTGNDVTTTFAFTFKVFAASDLQLVRTNTSTGVSTTLTITADYTVTLNSEQNSAPGGSITLTSPLASGYTLIITSDIAALQATDLTNQGGFYPQVITNALDKLTILVQQILNKVGRSLNFPIQDTNYNPTLPAKAQRVGRVLAFDETTGDPTPGPSVADVGTVLANTVNINIVATNIADVNTVAGDIANVNTVAANIADVDTIVANMADVNTVATNIADVNTVVANMADIDAVVANMADINIVASDIANVDTVATNIADVNTVVVNMADIDAVVANMADINSVATNMVDVNAVAANETEIDALAARTTEIDALYAELPNIATKVSKTSNTGSAAIPVGTEAQRDGTPSAGYFRFNQDIGKFEGYNGTNWGSVGGGATGGGSDEVFIQNNQVVTADYTIPVGKNAVSTGPITINSGVSVTVSSGSNWVIL